MKMIRVGTRSAMPAGDIIEVRVDEKLKGSGKVGIYVISRSGAKAFLDMSGKTAAEISAEVDNLVNLINGALV
jgi:hypothetical protein